MRTHLGAEFETQEDHVLLAINATLELRYHSIHIPDDRKSELLTLVGL